MQIVIKVSSATHAGGSKAIKCALDALGLAYSVEFLGDERSFCGSGSSITSTCQLKDLPVDDLDPAGLAYWEKQLSSEVVSVEALEGCVTGYAIDPLESAIESTVRLLREERESEAGQKGIKTVACQRLESHLDKLLALQLKQLNGSDEELIRKIQAMTEEVRANAEAMKGWASGFKVTP